jgi:hypothetical protein
MKSPRYLLIFGALLVGGCRSHRPTPPSAPTQQSGDFSELRFPFLDVPEDLPALDRLRENPASVQPWLSGSKKPPESLKDLGLSGELHLALFRRSQGDDAFPIVIADAQGRLFAFCATSETDYSGYGDAFVLGALRPSRALPRVLPGSASYRFLFSLVWSFADDKRYKPDPAVLEIARNRLRLSTEEFRQLLSEPKWSKSPTRR